MKWLALILTSFLVVATAYAASFDCSKAQSAVERLICDNPELSRLDEELAADYKSALQDQAQAGSIRRAQAQWLKQRDQCVDLACIKTTYTQRLRSLSNSPSPRGARGPSHDLCDNPADANLKTCFELGNYDLQDANQNLLENSDERERVELKAQEREWEYERIRQCRLVADSDYFSSGELFWGVIGEDDNKETRIKKVRCVISYTRARIAKLQSQSEAKQPASPKLREHFESAKDSEYSPPIIPSKGRTILDFIPRGYAIQDKVEADFNGDSKKDVAMILHKVPLLDFYPRPFLILFATSEGYTLSARNDFVAPAGGEGGIANPHGMDALKLRGRSILIENYGGGASEYSAYDMEFNYMKGGWYLVSTDELSGYRNGYLIKRQPDGWGIVQTGTHTDLASGKVTRLEYWSNENTGEERVTKTRGRDVEPQRLKPLSAIDWAE